jgi:hypothetical protein
MIGVTITPSHIDYSKIIDEKTVEKLIMGDCIIISGFAKELAPVDTGQLKNSIMWNTSKEEGDFNKGGGETAPDSAKLDKPSSEVEGYVGSGLEYAGAVEYGRKIKHPIPNYPMQPYLRPAMDYSKKQREARRKGIINVAIKQAYHG